MNTNIEIQQEKSSLVKKNNRVKEFLFNATVEMGAWALSGGLFVGIAWLAGTISQSI